MDNANQTYILKDEVGNTIQSLHAGATVTIKLKLASESRYRSIGSVFPATRRLELVRERGKHLFRKFNAYGFNHFILKNATLFDDVCITDEKGRFIVPKQVILNQGKFMNFKNHGGFELQIFLPLSEIEKYQIQSAI